MDTRLHVRRAAKTLTIAQGGIGKSIGAFYSGLAQITGLGSVMPMPAVRRRTDSEALKGDWIAVGADMYAAIEHERERAGR